MQLGRRHFLVGAAALSLSGTSGWAAAAGPAYLAAARDPDGGYGLYGLTDDGAALFHIPLPGRGHAGAAHPHRPEAIAFARRPGTFALVIDCAEGLSRARLEAPEGRHFYGHGTFSADGALLYTPENDFEAGEGRIGVWDASPSGGYARIGEFSSGGIGPHDTMLMPDGCHLIVANGGIQTHPDSGRAKLNLPTMRSTLALVSLRDGQMVQEWALPETLHLNSMRHLAMTRDGRVAAAMQWQGAVTDVPPLLALLDTGAQHLRLLAAPEPVQRQMQGYAGSVAFDAGGTSVAITSPRGGQLIAFDAASGEVIGLHRQPDICGLATSPSGFIVSDGQGGTCLLDGEARAHGQRRHNAQWDNHVVRLV
ncbi:DUF1513 domain-containing protein [Paroceanicella profunda]|uniref:DUF1513 domain-containing protein n=1 Tax=Paroceanicella profunda TaxID=2579971 RepID=A0A5B8FGC7_9RHOB|nr:DUF1513 domain-containing protein [Paroceanicella profunda]QDL91021.1 DUF1513 domain-containing protein [Paroceanicella profunda]